MTKQRHRVDPPKRVAKPLVAKVFTNTYAINTCNHCGGVINHGRHFELGAGCFLCGRAQSHVCPQCVTIPEGTVFEEDVKHETRR